MKISNNYTKAVSRGKASEKRPASGVEKFDSIFSESLEPTSATSQVSEAHNVERANSPMAVFIESDSYDAAKNEKRRLLQATCDKIDNLLDQLDSYANSLNDTDKESLRSVFELLQGMEKGIEKIKLDKANFEDSPALKAIINDLEVVATTEAFKLNRGDYL